MDLIVKEKFINAFSEELAVYLLSREPKDLLELTTWAQLYLTAHKQQLGSKNMERPRSSGNSKKKSLNGLASNDEAVYRAAGCANSNVGQIFIRVGKLNGRPVKVLRDTGCTGMIVDRALISKPVVIHKKFMLLADGKPHSDQCAVYQCFPVL